MTSYLLDTNHVSWLMAQRDSLVARLRQAQAAGDRFGISVTVLGELYYAVYASQRSAENLRRLQSLAGALLLWPFDALTHTVSQTWKSDQSAVEILGEMRR